MKISILPILILLLATLTGSSQVCVSVNNWSFTSDNGDGTCTYNFSVEVDSGNGASGTATFMVGSQVVHIESSCKCNPTTIDFPVTVTCGSIVNIDAVYDAPGNGNDCSGSSGAISLPVDWVSLNVGSYKDGNKLQWTVIEFDNEKFVIQNSDDGKHFDDIGEVISQGLEYVENEYDYYHEKPSIGTNYYRVKQIDIDGNYSYSDIVSIEGEATSQVGFSPNPFEDRIFINSDKSESWTISDSFGRVVMTGETNEITTSHLISGLYYLHVKTASGVNTQSMLKM